MHVRSILHFILFLRPTLLVVAATANKLGYGLDGPEIERCV